ncbi:MAG: long-chain fatty acid--CoA ligase, partial [Rhodospirillaceae bacterium]|nr:long-chain fatty acid--CoA ligase [Rhodospirillaceae bacterium]
TTGQPKGVVHGRFRSDDAAARHGVFFEWDATSTTLIVAPVFHLTGSVWVQSSLCIGAKQVMSASTSAALIVSAIQRWNVTHTVLVPTMVRMVLDELKASGTSISTLKTITYGGAPMPVALLREAISTLGAKFVQGYGLTETNSPVTMLRPEDHALEGPRAKLLNAVGRDYLDIKIRIVDTETGAVLKAGEVGEVQISTPWGMLGYRNQPDLTAAAYTSDGWFRTGDGGYLDEERYLFLCDRINDMIISGGENVMPSEVENVLTQHSGITEAAVFAVKDPKWGETICAAVVAKPGAAPVAEEVIGFTRARLAHYKCPREVVLIDVMPRNAMGKILRRELRARFSKE